jgi:pyruvate-ferredoxin/flavodoxin oxidoreductase
MGKAQAEIKKAVECGYWQLYRYNPELENPMTVDSKDPYTLQLCQDGIGSNRTEAVTVSADGIEGKLRELL